MFEELSKLIPVEPGPTHGIEESRCMFTNESPAYQKPHPLLRVKFSFSLLSIDNEPAAGLVGVVGTRAFCDVGGA